jgi:hypothetical protein
MLVGALAGMIPYAAFLESLKFVAVYVAGTLSVALALIIRHVPAKNELPSVAEHIHAVLAGTAYSASAGFMGFLLYGFAYVVTYAIGSVGDWLQLAWQVNPADVAFWASGPATLLFGLVALLFSPVPRTLYPYATSFVSAYEGLLRRSTLGRCVSLVLGGAALSILTYFFWPGSWWWYVVAVFIIVGGGGESMRVATKWSPKAALGSDAVQALQKLYSVLGYYTVMSPRTKESNADVDSLLKTIDLLATREKDAIVVELKTPLRTSRAVSAADASILPMAARALSRYLNKAAVAPVLVQPVLVLIGGEPTEDLGRLAEEEHIKVLSLTEDAVREVLKTEDETVLRQLAQRHLLADPAVPPQTAPSPVASGAP